MAAIQNESKIPVGAVLLGKYKVTREIGRGGMAAVYEALHLSLNKRIAIKVLAAELSASTVVIERFFREARAAASVKSPHIVDIYDSGRLDDGRPFIAMELLEGESLYDRMARIRIIDIPTTVRVIQHCAKGLMKAHAAGSFTAISSRRTSSSRTTRTARSSARSSISGSPSSTRR